MVLSPKEKEKGGLWVFCNGPKEKERAGGAGFSAPRLSLYDGPESSGEGEKRALGFLQGS